MSSWDISTGVDGPGTRFVVFLAGCELRCLYCQNPETWHMRDGKRMPAIDVLAEAAKYARFISVAGGGATISGGEPLLQPDFAHELFRGFTDLGLHTALDTSGALGHRASDELLADVDLVLLDIKSWDRETYRKVTGERYARPWTSPSGSPSWTGRRWSASCWSPDTPTTWTTSRAPPSSSVACRTCSRWTCCPFTEWRRLSTTSSGWSTRWRTPIRRRGSCCTVREQFRSHGVAAS